PNSPRRDVERARAWLEEAAALGHYRAREVLKLEAAGQSLSAGMRYLLRTPYEDRYVKDAAMNAAPPDERGQVKPVVTRVVKPIYPQSLRLITQQGEALVGFVVNKTGRVEDATVVSATHPLI